MVAWTIRPLGADDAGALAALAWTPSELRFGEHDPTEPLETFVARIGDGSPDPGGALGAFAGEELIAAAVLRRRFRPRRHHRAQIWLYGGVEQGAGRDALADIVDRVLDAADRWSNIVRSEMACVEGDPRLEALLVPRGFVAEGRLRGSLLREGACVDERVLGRLRPGWSASPAPLDAGPPTMPARRPAPMSIRMRDVTPDDAQAMFELMSAPSVVWGTAQSPLQSSEHWLRLLSSHDPEQRIGFCAEVDGAFAGNATLIRSPSPRRRHDASLGMAVHPAFQGMALGQGLLDAAIARAEEWGVSRVSLEVYPDNVRAVRLYESRGFEHEAVLPAAVFRDGTFVPNLAMARLAALTD